MNFCVVQLSELRYLVFFSPLKKKSFECTVLAEVKLGTESVCATVTMQIQGDPDRDKFSYGQMFANFTFNQFLPVL